MVEQFQERIARLEQENMALQAEIVDLRQRFAIAESKTTLNQTVEPVTINETMPAEIPLRQRAEVALNNSDRRRWWNSS